MGSRENSVVSSCCKVLDILGLPWMRNNSGCARVIGAGGKMRPMSFGKPGWPDILFVLPGGRLGGCECKAPAIAGLYRKKAAGKLSPVQVAVHETLRKQGAFVITVESSQQMVNELRAAGLIDR